jgi:predicted dehydrogenase
MKELKEVCWGIIGVGDVCEVKSAPVMHLIKDSKFVAVKRRSAEEAKDYARRHIVQKWYSDANQLIYDSEVNAIYSNTTSGISDKDQTTIVGS